MAERGEGVYFSANPSRPGIQNKLPPITEGLRGRWNSILRLRDGEVASGLRREESLLSRER